MGKKYVIEIDEEPFTRNGNKLYRATNFASLVFDSYGLSLLEEYKEPEPEIRVGDVVETENGDAIIVTFFTETYFEGISIPHNGNNCAVWAGIERSKIKKILRHYSYIDDILEDLRA